MQTADSLEKSVMLGKIESRRRGHQRMDRTTNAMELNLCKLREMVRDSESLHAAVHGTRCKGSRVQRVGHDWVIEQQHHYLHIPGYN